LQSWLYFYEAIYIDRELLIPSCSTLRSEMLS